MNHRLSNGSWDMIDIHLDICRVVTATCLRFNHDKLKQANGITSRGSPHNQSKHAHLICPDKTGSDHLQGCVMVVFAVTKQCIFLALMWCFGRHLYA